jgi:hypothetical protein
MVTKTFSQSEKIALFYVRDLPKRRGVVSKYCVIPQKGGYLSIDDNIIDIHVYSISVQIFKKKKKHW